MQKQVAINVHMTVSTRAYFSFVRPRVAGLDGSAGRAASADAGRPRGPGAGSAQDRVVHAALLRRALRAYGGK